MSKPIAARFREDRPEKTSEILDRTTFNRCTVFYLEIRNGTRSITVRKTNENPQRYHLYRLNEHGAYCHDREVDRHTAGKVIDCLRDADSYITAERKAAEDVWPGDPYRKHPSYKGPATGGVHGP